MKTLLIATSLLVAGTSATLAQGGYGRNFGQTYTYSHGYHDPAFIRGYYDAAPGFGVVDNYSGTASGQPSPSSGIEAERG